MRRTEQSLQTAWPTHAGPDDPKRNGTEETNASDDDPERKACAHNRGAAGEQTRHTRCSATADDAD
jgi:hypothetical protein